MGSRIVDVFGLIPSQTMGDEAIRELQRLCEKQIPELDRDYDFYEYFYRRKFITLEEVRKHIEISEKIREINDDKLSFPLTVESAVIDIKEKEIKLEFILLMNEVHNYYLKEAKRHGLELNKENFKEAIIEDYTFRDLVPGSTTIGFEIWTKRKLVKK